VFASTLLLGGRKIVSHNRLSDERADTMVEHKISGDLKGPGFGAIKTC
jgi:hypothetical protein